MGRFREAVENNLNLIEEEMAFVLGQIHWYYTQLSSCAEQLDSPTCTLNSKFYVYLSQVSYCCVK